MKRLFSKLKLSQHKISASLCASAVNVFKSKLTAEAQSDAEITQSYCDCGKVHNSPVKGWYHLRVASGYDDYSRACVQVDEIESDLHWRNAMAFGKFEEINKPNERADVLK